MLPIKYFYEGIANFLIAAGIIVLIFLWPDEAKPEQRDIYRPLNDFAFNFTTAGATPSSTMNAQTRIARVLCTAACGVSFSASPVITSSTDAVYLPANTSEYFKVPGGGTIYVVGISGAGTVYVTEME